MKKNYAIDAIVSLLAVLCLMYAAYLKGSRERAERLIAPVELAGAHSDSLSVAKQLRLEVLTEFQSMDPQLIRLSAGEFDCNSEIDRALVQMMAFYISGDLELMKREAKLIEKERTQ